MSFVISMKYSCGENPSEMGACFVRKVWHWPGTRMKVNVILLWVIVCSQMWFIRFGSLLLRVFLCAILISPSCSQSCHWLQRHITWPWTGACTRVCVCVLKRYLLGAKISQMLPRWNGVSFPALWTKQQRTKYRVREGGGHLISLTF